MHWIVFNTGTGNNIIPGTDATHSSQLIDKLLNDSTCYGHRVDRVRLVETHISWVLLTGEFAYKIKKPVNLGFLDFSTLTRRAEACFEELRLNRRLAPAMYIGVVGITGGPDKPYISGNGIFDRSRVFEYAVKMRQFPPDTTLDRLAERGGLGDQHIDALAARLATFHLDECDTATDDSSYGGPEAILHPVEENFRILADRLKKSDQYRLLGKLRSWSMNEHDYLTPFMLERKRSGKVRECHGDLHLGNLAWVNGQLLIFDCLEFDPALRWIDLISEVAFCFMDLLHRQLPGLGMRFLNAWLEKTGDYEGVALLRYYSVYRAIVRAKVAALRTEQHSTSNNEVAECLQLAGQLMQMPSTSLWITHGYSGSGKTTISQDYLQKYGMIRVRSDIERKRLSSLGELEDSGSGSAKNHYTVHATLNTYQHMGKVTVTLLQAGWPVIVDATFLKRWQRDLFKGIALRQGVNFQILTVAAGSATLRKRILRRMALGRDASEADLQVLHQQIETSQPLGADELISVIPPEVFKITN